MNQISKNNLTEVIPSSEINKRVIDLMTKGAQVVQQEIQEIEVD